MTKRSDSPELGQPLAFSHYDTRHYRTLPVVEGYRLWSECYGELDRRFDLDLLDHSSWLAQRVKGARVIDLGCGNGRIGVWLDQAGAQPIHGIDICQSMLAGAHNRAIYEQLGEAEITDSQLPSANYDGAISSMALCHVQDLQAFYREVRRLLKPGGWLVFVDYHPYFMFQGIPSHFHHPGKDEDIAVENAIHSHAQHFNSGSAEGFSLVEFNERFVDQAWVDDKPGYEPYRGRPITYLMGFERPFDKLATEETI